MAFQAISNSLAKVWSGFQVKQARFAYFRILSDSDVSL